MRDLLARRLGEGKTWPQIKNELLAMFEGAGIPKPALSRLRFSYLESVRRSYAEARRAVLEEEAVQSNFEYWQYLTVGNGRPGYRNVREDHAALHGKVFAATDPVWKRFYPPWDFGCRCTVIPLTAGAVRRGKMTVWTYRGGRVVRANGTRRGRGFQLKPNEKYDRSADKFDLSSLDADLRKALERRIK
jgi:SPP1 gp7 family putative phage head morphogenesis protein